MYPQNNSIGKDANETKDVSKKDASSSENNEPKKNDEPQKQTSQFTVENSKPETSNFITDYYASLFIDPD